MTDIKLEDAAQSAEAEYERKLEADADAALDRIQRGQSWDDWLKVAELFSHGRKQAMLYAHTNKPEGKGYNLWFSGWMERHPKLRSIDKATRNHCFQCFENKATIEKWRSHLGQNQRETINHPTSVWRRWQRENASEETTKAVKKQNKATMLAEQLATYEAENKKLRDKIDKSGENLFALSDTPRNMAMALAGNLSLSKLSELAKELNHELTKRRKMEADRKRVGPK